MSQFPLTPEDARQIAEWTCAKNAALAFLTRWEALVAESPQDNPFLGSLPLDVSHARQDVVIRFVQGIVGLLADHYHCPVDTGALLKDRPRDCAAETVLDRGIQRLNGQSLPAFVQTQIRDALAQQTRSSVWSLSDQKVTISHCLYFRESGDHTYHLFRGHLVPLINAVAYWATGAYYVDWRLWSIIRPQLSYAPADAWFRVHPTPVSAVKGIRYFKNGRVDIIFATADQARDFAAQYGPSLSV